MEEFFREIVERAHYYEQFETFREYGEYELICQKELNREK